MRRAALVVAVGLLARSAWAEPWTVTAEAGGEADSNVRRLESDDPKRISAPVGRLGARLDAKSTILGGGYVLGVSSLARVVPISDAKDENVALLAADARWLHAIGTQPITAGIGITAADALPITGGIGARTFRNLGADALIGLGSETHHLLLALGGRDFIYKEDARYNWQGPTASARLDFMLWQPSGETHSLELGVTLGFELREYTTRALADMCHDDQQQDCGGGTSLPRRDRFQRAGIELDWTGDIVATAGYQLTVIDSNSFGQSLVRHRVTASATTELFDKLFGTATAILQIDQYPDGILVANITNQVFTNLEDESRSSIQVRLARELTREWSLEVRGAIWRDLSNPDAGTFRRELVYAGAIYSH